MAYPKSILSHYGRGDTGKEEKPRSLTNNVNPEQQINALKKYIENGRSNYQDGFMIVNIARAAVRKTAATGADTSGFEQEIDALEIPAYTRYLTDGINKLEEHRNSKVSMDPRRQTELAKGISLRLQALENRGIDVSGFRERFNAIMDSE